MEVPPEGDYLWNFTGTLDNPQWCVSATAILQTAAAQDVLQHPDAKYYDLPNVNTCTKFDTPLVASYEVPSKDALVASYKKVTTDLEVDAQYGRLRGTVGQT